jgi:hypothetical protein
MIFKKSEQTKGKYIYGLLLSAYIFFLLVDTFHYHSLHFTGPSNNPEIISVSSSQVIHSAENLADGCYLVNYVNSIFNIDSLTKNDFQFHDIPLLIHSGKAVLNQPQGYIPVIQLRGPPNPFFQV